MLVPDLVLHFKLQTGNWQWRILLPDIMLVLMLRFHLFRQLAIAPGGGAPRAG